MATSRSSDEGIWNATAFVFSGRPDPTWRLGSSTADELERIWARLAPANRAAEPAARLGYSGCAVHTDRGRTWTAYEGLVTHQEAEREERRADPERAFERAVLASAPPGVLPPVDLPS